ncbi:MAG: PaaI family thioesterase [Pseudomonadota bacterium]
MTTDAPSRRDIARRFIEALPHCRALKLTVDDVGDGEAVMSLPYADHLVGDPATGVIHGGAVSALMDTCGGTAVMAHPAGPAMTATLDIRIDYMRAATPGRTVTAKATCYHLTRSVAFVRAVAHDGDENDPVATAAGAFTVQGVKD